MESTIDTPTLETGSTEARLAGMGNRAFAAIMDGILMLPVFGAMVALCAIWNHVPASEDGNSVHLTGVPALEAMFLSTILWCGYCFLLEAWRGMTLGKEILGVEVRAENGGRCGVDKALVRNLLRPVDVIGFYLLGFIVALSSPRNQRIGDRVARTVVNENGSHHRVRAVLIWLGAFATLICLGIMLIHSVPTS